MSAPTAIFISGRGSNLAHVLEQLPLDVRLVVSSRKNAKGLKIARTMGLDCLWQRPNQPYEHVNQLLRKMKIRRILLLGYLRLLPDDFVQAWQSCMTNIHPSLLPHFKGLKSIQAAYDASAEMGASLHWVRPEMDSGPIIRQIKILNSHEVNSLSYRKAESLVHLGEQRIIRGAFQNAN